MGPIREFFHRRRERNQQECQPGLIPEAQEKYSKEQRQQITDRMTKRMEEMVKKANELNGEAKHHYLTFYEQYSKRRAGLMAKERTRSETLDTLMALIDEHKSTVDRGADVERIKQIFLAQGKSLEARTEAMQKAWQEAQKGGTSLPNLERTRDALLEYRMALRAEWDHWRPVGQRDDPRPQLRGEYDAKFAQIKADATEALRAYNEVKKDIEQETTIREQGARIRLLEDVSQYSVRESKVVNTAMPVGKAPPESVDRAPASAVISEPSPTASTVENVRNTGEVQIPANTSEVQPSNLTRAPSVARAPKLEASVPESEVIQNYLNAFRNALDANLVNLSDVQKAQRSAATYFANGVPAPEAGAIRLLVGGVQLTPEQQREFDEFNARVQSLQQQSLQRNQGPFGPRNNAL